MAVIVSTGKERSWVAALRRVMDSAWHGTTNNAEQAPLALYNESILAVNKAGTGTNGLIKSGANAAAVDDSTLLTNGAEIPTGKTLNIVDAAGLTYAAGATVAPGTAAGVVTIGTAAGTGDIVVGSSSAAEAVKIANGAGAPTVTVANVSVAGATVTVAGAATGGAAVDTVNIATGNAASTAAKKVNIATGTPNTSGNNQVIIGGGATSAVTINGVFSYYREPNLQLTETGANNAIAAALTDAAGTNVTLAAGLCITVKLAHTLQIGANTFNLNGGGAVNLKSSRNPANNVATGYASTGFITMLYDGTQWLDCSQ